MPFSAFPRHLHRAHCALTLGQFWTKGLHAPCLGHTEFTLQVWPGSQLRTESQVTCSGRLSGLPDPLIGKQETKPSLLTSQGEGEAPKEKAPCFTNFPLSLPASYLKGKRLKSHLIEQYSRNLSGWRDDGPPRDSTGLEPCAQIPLRAFP